MSTSLKLAVSGMMPPIWWASLVMDWGRRWVSPQSPCIFGHIPIVHHPRISWVYQASHGYPAPKSCSPAGLFCLTKIIPLTYHMWLHPKFVVEKNPHSSLMDFHPHPHNDRPLRLFVLGLRIQLYSHIRMIPSMIQYPIHVFRSHHLHV